MNHIEGIHPIEELLRHSPERIKMLYYLSGKRISRKVENLLTLAEAHKISIRPVPPGEVPEPKRPSQGIWADTGTFAFMSLEAWLLARQAETVSTLFILDSVTDPHNLGAIIRSSACLGGDGVLISKHRSAPVSPAVWKTSAGAAASHPVIRESNLVRSVKRLKKAGFWVFSAASAAETSLRNVGWPDRAAIVLGSEGKGIRPLLKSNCDVHFSIPMTGSIDSLNVSVAAGIILYERLRHRQRLEGVREPNHVQD